MDAFMWGLASILAIVLVVIVTPLLAGAVKKVAVPAGATAWFRPRWLAIVAGVVILGWLLYAFWPNLQGGDKATINNLDIVISVGILLALAIGAIFGKFGTAGKLTLAVVGLIVVLLGPTGAFKFWSNVQGTTKDVVLEGKPILSASSPEPSAAANAAGVETMVKLGLNECTQTLTVHNNQCLTYREEKMRASTFRPEVFNVSTQAWEAIPVGAFRNARFWRFCATEEDIKLFYSITQKPTEGCQSNTR